MKLSDLFVASIKSDNYELGIDGTKNMATKMNCRQALYALADIKKTRD